MLSQEDLDVRSMPNGVRMIYVGQDFSNIDYLVRHRAHNKDVYHFPSDRMPRHYTAHEPDRVPSEAFLLPPSTMVNELLSQYFRHINPGCPIVDEETFMTRYKARDTTNPPSLLVLQSILMVGAHVSQDRSDRDRLKATFFRRAKMLFDARFERNLDAMVQAALLLTWHSEGIDDVGANVYHWVGVAIRIAHGLGMHRDNHCSTLMDHDKRIWRRLWWILVQYDVMIALAYGRPLAVNLEDSDVSLLTNSDFEGAVTSLSPEDTEVAADFTIHHTKLCCILAKALRERFGLRVDAEKRQLALQRSDQLLAEWQIQLPCTLRHGSSYRSTWSAMLHIMYSNILILLHRPAPKPTSIASGVKPDDVGQ